MVYFLYFCPIMPVFLPFSWYDQKGMHTTAFVNKIILIIFISPSHAIH